MQGGGQGSGGGGALVFHPWGLAAWKEADQFAINLLAFGFKAHVALLFIYVTDNLFPEFV